MNPRERKLVEGLRSTLADKFQRIEIHRRPYNSPKLRRCLKTVLGYDPILQPELDMVLWRKSELVAVEAKVFTPPSMRSFDEGIGQALALHRFGFDYASLWCLFLDVNEDDLRRGSTSWSFIRDLDLPLDFTYFTMETTSGGLDECRFIPRQYLDSQQDYGLLDIAHPEFRIDFRYPNPIRDVYEQRAIRIALELWFDDVLTVEHLTAKLEPYDRPPRVDYPPTTAQLFPRTHTSSEGKFIFLEPDA